MATVEAYRRRRRQSPARASRGGAGTRLARTWMGMRSMAALLEIGLVASVAALVVLWLALPDTSVFGKALSVALVLGVAVVLPWAQSAVLILLRRGTLTGVKAWKGGLLLAGLGLVYWLVATFFDAGALQDAERSQRWVDDTWVWHLASAETLAGLEAGMWWLLRWAVVGLLLPLGIEGAARGLSTGWLRAGTVPLRRWLYWATLLTVAAVGTVATETLLPPRTGLPVLLEVGLAVMAAGLVFVLDVGGLCLVLSLTATYLRDAERDGDRAAARVAVGSAANLVESPMELGEWEEGARERLRPFVVGRSDSLG